MSIIGLGVGEAIGGIAQGIGGVAQGVGGVAQGAGAVLSKLGDVLKSPVNMMCNWAEEPLRRAEHKRQEESKDKEVQRVIESQVGVEKALSNQRMQENEFSTDMKIKRETEIFRIINEIEQLKKDKEFERMKKVSDAMMEYQKELTRINVEAVEAIGSMRIDLQRKAYELIHEKTQQYTELQDKAIQQAEDCKPAPKEKKTLEYVQKLVKNFTTNNVQALIASPKVSKYLFNRMIKLNSI